MDDLPAELLVHIASFLPPRDVAGLSGVSTHCRHALRTEARRHWCVQRWRDALPVHSDVARFLFCAASARYGFQADKCWQDALVLTAPRPAALAHVLAWLKAQGLRVDSATADRAVCAAARGGTLASALRAGASLRGRSWLVLPPDFGAHAAGANNVPLLAELHARGGLRAVPWRWVSAAVQERVAEALEWLLPRAQLDVSAFHECLEAAARADWHAGLVTLYAHGNMTLEKEAQCQLLRACLGNASRVCWDWVRAHSRWCVRDWLFSPHGHDVGVLARASTVMLESLFQDYRLGEEDVEFFEKLLTAMAQSGRRDALCIVLHACWEPPEHAGGPTRYWYWAIVEAAVHVCLFHKQTSVDCLRLLCGAVCVQDVKNRVIHGDYQHRRIFPTYKPHICDEVVALLKLQADDVAHFYPAALMSNNVAHVARLEAKMRRKGLPVADPWMEFIVKADALQSLQHLASRPGAHLPWLSLLEYACRHGTLALVKFVCAAGGSALRASVDGMLDRPLQRLFLRGALQDNTHLVESFIWRHFQLAHRAGMPPCRAFLKACGAGDLAVAREIWVQPEVYGLDMSAQIAPAACAALENGHAAVLQWLHACVPLHHVQDVLMDPLVTACRRGHLEAAQVVARCLPALGATHMMPALEGAAATGHAPVVAWLLQTWPWAPLDLESLLSSMPWQVGAAVALDVVQAILDSLGILQPLSAIPPELRRGLGARWPMAGIARVLWLEPAGTFAPASFREGAQAQARWGQCD